MADQAQWLVALHTAAMSFVDTPDLQRLTTAGYLLECAGFVAKTLSESLGALAAQPFKSATGDEA